MRVNKTSGALVLWLLATAGCALQGGTVPLARRLPTVTVTCVVLAVDDGPIADARCQSEGIGATTDRQGVARLMGVPVGDRLLVVTAAGYDPGQQPYTLSMTDVTVTVYLRVRGSTRSISSADHLGPALAREVIELLLQGGHALRLNAQHGFDALEAPLDGGASEQHGVEVSDAWASLDRFFRDWPRSHGRVCCHA